MIIEKFSIERVDGLVDSLLGRENQPSPVRIIANCLLLLRRCDQFQKFARQHFGRLDVNSQASDIAAFCNNRNSDTIIMRERTGDTGRP